MAQKEEIEKQRKEIKKLKNKAIGQSKATRMWLP